jgi:hypothetical protein
MSGRGVKHLLEATPVDRDGEERAWELVRAAYAEREPAPHRTHRRAGLVVFAAVAALVAAALSPPGRAVVHAMRKSIGIPGAQPALFRLPAPGRLLVSGPGGAWVIAADGSKRRLGSFREAQWSPHDLFVVAASPNELATLEPNGTEHWSLARPRIRFPRWGGSRADTRVAYLTNGRLRVVAGDGTGDRAVSRDVAAVPPTWKPGPKHLLAVAAVTGRVLLLDTDRNAVTWRSRAFVKPRLLTWSPGGSRLALATGTEVVVLDGRTGRAQATPLRGVRALAFSHAGSLAVLQDHAVLVFGGAEPRTLFATRAPLAGLAWSPDGRWLLTGLPAADQWVFLQTAGGRRVLAVSHLRRQFGGMPDLDGWVSGP